MRPCFAAETCKPCLVTEETRTEDEGRRTKDGGRRTKERLATETPRSTKNRGDCVKRGLMNGRCMFLNPRRRVWRVQSGITKLDFERIDNSQEGLARAETGFNRCCIGVRTNNRLCANTPVTVPAPHAACILPRLPHTHTLTLPHTHTLPHPHSHTLTLRHTHTLPHTHSHTLTPTHSLSDTPTLPHTHRSLAITTRFLAVSSTFPSRRIWAIPGRVRTS